ncbi:MAG: methyl-accepting chemotaxis protein [Spirochaetales bacterium]|nr:methyl-accepting chemotaxis protein [Spirochaetales bacterium]
MKKKQTSVKKRIIFLSIIIPLLLSLAFATTVALLQAQSAYEKEKESLLTSADNIQTLISLEMSESVQILRNLAVNPLAAQVCQGMDGVPSGLDNDDFIDLEGARDLSQLMDAVSQGTNADLVFIGATDTTGLLLSRDVQLAEGFDVRGRDYYKMALASPDSVVISQPRVSAEKTAEPKIVITAAMAVQNDSGKTVGIVALNYSFDPIIKIIRDLMEQFGVRITFYDRMGSYILWNNGEGGVPYFYDPQNEVTLNDLGADLGYGEEKMPGIIDALVNQESYFFLGNSSEGAAMLQGRRVGQTRWGIIVAELRDEIYRDIRRTVFPPMIIFIVFFGVMQLVVFILYTRSIINPLAGVGRKLEDLAAADADMTVSIPVTSQDEIGLVASSFNDFVGKLRLLMIDVKKAIDETDQVRMEVSSSTEETSTAIEEISANLESIRKQIDGLDSSISESVTALQQMTGNIESMDNEIISQSAMVEESTAAITQMMASLSNVNNVAHNKRETTRALAQVATEGKNMISSTSETFRMVVENINEIQSMASTISGIAARTNLLSMNAAIEASHAGDAGRGFAVVAEEIRKLADSSGASSKKISQVIKDVTSSVTETDKNVEMTAQAFEKIFREVSDTIDAFTEIEQSVSELNIGGRQILESTTEISNVTSVIRNSSAQIKEGTTLILDNSSRVQEISEVVTRGMMESTTGSREIVTSMQQIVNQTQKLTDIIRELKDNFGQFRTE